MRFTIMQALALGIGEQDTHNASVVGELFVVSFLKSTPSGKSMSSRKPKLNKDGARSHANPLGTYLRTF